jgi:outer membrane protein OmpA-like peptidoglycan-associated protein
LEVKGFGETKPIIKCEPNCDSEDFAKNRRVEVNIVSR